MTSSVNLVAGELEDLVQRAMTRHRVPGAAIGVLHGGREHVAALGVTNVEHPLPVTPDTLFALGSITKTVTAMAVMRLVELGDATRDVLRSRLGVAEDQIDRARLDLDVPVRAYLPDLDLGNEAATASTTLRHLLTHTAGWQGGGNSYRYGYGEDALARSVASWGEGRTNVPIRHFAPPGAFYAYNSAGFNLAGRVLEVVSGKPCELVLRELVLRQLGMDTSFFLPWEILTHRFAVGHVVRDGEPRVHREPHEQQWGWVVGRIASANGGLMSTAADALRYLRFWLGDGAAHDGTRLLAPATMSLMTSPLVRRGETDAAVGLGWQLWESAGERGVRVLQHGGSVSVQRAELVVVPERGFAAVILTNATTGQALRPEISDWLLDRCVGIVRPEPRPFARPAHELAPFAGTYAGFFRAPDLDITPDGGGLVLRAAPRAEPLPLLAPSLPTGESRLEFITAHEALVVDGPAAGRVGTFIRRADGSVGWFQLLSGVGIDTYVRHDG